MNKNNILTWGIAILLVFSVALGITLFSKGPLGSPLYARGGGGGECPEHFTPYRIPLSKTKVCLPVFDSAPPSASDRGVCPPLTKPIFWTDFCLVPGEISPVRRIK